MTVTMARMLVELRNVMGNWCSFSVIFWIVFRLGRTSWLPFGATSTEQEFYRLQPQ